MFITPDILGHQKTLRPTFKRWKADYLKTSDCRRKTLLLNFDTGSTVSLPHPMHMCCDNCAIKCECSASDCGQLTTFPGTRTIIESKNNCSRTRQGTVAQWIALRGRLYSYHRTLVLDLIAKSNGELVKSLTKPQVPLRFSDLQVSQVLEHVNKVFTVEDICSHVEVYGDIRNMDVKVSVYCFVLLHLCLFFVIIKFSHFFRSHTFSFNHVSHSS